MEGSSYLFWVPLFLSCIFQASDSQHVVNTVVREKGASDVSSIHSYIPKEVLDGIDPKNINITTIISKTCVGLPEQLRLLNKQLQETTARNRELDYEGSGLRGKVRHLEVQLAACTSTAPNASSGCNSLTGYHTELQNRLNQMLDTFDNDQFLILKLIRLSTEMNTLQNRLKLITTDSTEMSAAARLLQQQLRGKQKELDAKKQQIKGNNTNSALIFEIISLQIEMWDLGQKGGTSDQIDARIQALQDQLNKKIKELSSKKDATSDTLDLISVHIRIPVLERLISVYSQKSKSNVSDYQKQWRENSELLKQKILLLNDDQTDKQLTQGIMELQMEVERLRFLKENTRKTTEAQLKALRELLELEKSRQELLQKQLQESEHAQAHLIIKIVTTMNDLRETHIDETASTNPATLLALLQEKQRDYTKAQAEITELQKKLQLQSEECSGLETKYSQIRTEFEQRIAELQRSGEPEAALILNVINLQHEIRTLRDVIFVTEDSELQRQLVEKQEQLKLKTAEVERLVANPSTILTIITLQDEIQDLQKTATNESISKRVTELQTRVDGLISELEGGDGNTHLMLKILTLHNQVENLQTQLTDLGKLHVSQISRLRNDLATKRNERLDHIAELMKRNQTNGRLILETINLHSQLRTSEEQWHKDNATSSLIIIHLKEELREKRRENTGIEAELRALKALLETARRERNSAQAAIRELQRKLQTKTEECSGLEERYNETKAEFERMIVELKQSGENKAALILSVINLHGELTGLTDLIATTREKDPDKTSVLERQLKQTQDKLTSKTAELQRLSTNPRLIVKIIQLQNELLDLHRKDTDGTRRNEAEGLQNQVLGLLSEIDNSADENIKLMLQIITLQSRVEQLQRLLSSLKALQNTEVTALTNDLTSTKNQLQIYVGELKKNNQTNANLILRITDLTNQLRNLEVEKQNESNTTAATIADLKEQLRIKVKEHTDDQAKVKALQENLNEKEAQCSSSEQQLKVVQAELNDKITQLLSKSDSVTSLALQISTLNLQLEESKRQIQNTESLPKIKELQKIIDEKTKEVTKKNEELKERSPQAQRLLHIITIQTEIEKYVNVAVNDTDYAKIRAMEERLNRLIDGIQDEENENTKLTFKVLAQQDEIERLKKIEDGQNKSYSEKIAALQNELERIKNLIGEKIRLLNSSDIRIINLSFQIMDLRKKIKPLEEEIAQLKETKDENLKTLQKRLNLAKKQLQDSELQLSEADEKNVQLILEIADLRSQLKKVPKVSEKQIKELEQKLQTQQTQIKNLEMTNSDLKQEVSDLKSSCSDPAICEDVQIQLQQSLEELKRLRQQLQDKDAKVRQLQESSNEQTRLTNRLQQEYNDLEKRLQQSQALDDHLQQQLSEREALINQLQTTLDGRTRDYYTLLDDHNKLQSEKTELEGNLEDIQNKLTDKEDKTIHPRRMTLDPNTAHPRILLSAGNTEMSTVAMPQNVPDNPGRFDADLAVLGAIGFSRGRQYWEVSVDGKICYHIGMASEAAQRKGNIRYSPANGYWTIVLNKQGQFKAFDKRPLVIQVQTQPVRLGILLDYRNGQISFYDAGTRSHIYSFAGQKFTDKIYAFINYCVEETENPSPLVLLTPGSVDWIQ